MLTTKQDAIQVFPVERGTEVFPGGVTDYAITSDAVVHTFEDSTVTVKFPEGRSITFDSPAGWDFGVSQTALTIDVSGNCIIS